MHKEVNLEIAQLLLEKKIDTSVSPTIFEVVIKLYDKHKIWISPQPFVKRDGLVVWLFDIFKDNFIIEQLQPSKGVSTPTEAYLKAIEHTLKTLI